MVYKMELIRSAINTASQYLAQGDQDRAELFLDKFSTDLVELNRELEEFYELTAFMSEQERLKL